MNNVGKYTDSLWAEWSANHKTFVAKQKQLARKARHRPVVVPPWAWAPASAYPALPTPRFPFREVGGRESFTKLHDPKVS